MNNDFPWWIPQVGGEERKLVDQVLDSNYLNDGDVTTEFEQELAKLLGCKHVVAVTNCTAALFLVMAGLGIGEGDEVIVPDVTFIATANAVVLAGAKPVLVDVDPSTMNISPESFASAITTRTKAVIPVHVSGRAANMQEINRIAEKHGLYVIEDAAEGFMSRLDGRCLGTFGKAGCLSFSPNKIITTGQGGVILTNDDQLHVRLRELKDQGRPVRGTGGADIHNSVGYNFKLTNLQAAIGLGQLKLLEDRLKKMKEIYALYQKHLGDVKEVSLFKFDIEGGESPQWIDAVVEDRDGLDEFLRKKGIYCRKYWYPLHTQKPYKQSDGNFPVSSQLSEKALWLPSAFTLTEENIKYVCTQVKSYYRTK